VFKKDLIKLETKIQISNFYNKKLSTKFQSFDLNLKSFSFQIKKIVEITSCQVLTPGHPKKSPTILERSEKESPKPAFTVKSLIWPVMKLVLANVASRKAKRNLAWMANKKKEGKKEKCPQNSLESLRKEIYNVLNKTMLVGNRSVA